MIDGHAFREQMASVVIFIFPSTKRDTDTFFSSFYATIYDRSCEGRSAYECK